MEDIRENFNRIRERIEKAAFQGGLRPGDVLLVAATKTIGIDRISEGIQAGLHIFGENRVQEAEGKITRLGHKVEWHMIGHLQTNKVKKAIELFDLIHSMDSLHLAGEIEKKAAQAGKCIPILLQVDLAGEEKKFGFPKKAVFGALDQMLGFNHIRILGLMTIPPFSSDPEDSRHYFRELAKLKAQIAQAYPGDIQLDCLSMGMSQDFEVAIEEGANMVRIGTALFGPRCCH